MREFNTILRQRASAVMGLDKNRQDLTRDNQDHHNQSDLKRQFDQLLAQELEIEAELPDYLLVSARRINRIIKASRDEVCHWTAAFRDYVLDMVHELDNAMVHHSGGVAECMAELIRHSSFRDPHCGIWL